MKAYTFPMSCPVCGTPVRTAPDAVNQHSACMQLAARCVEWSNAMRSMADNWPGSAAPKVEPFDSVAKRVRARMGRT